MDSIIVNGKSHKVVAYLEISGADMGDIFRSYIRDGAYDLKLVGWDIIERATLIKGTDSALRVFENAIEWAVGMKAFNVKRAYNGTGKRPKAYRFAFTRDDVYLVRSDGMVIL